MGPDRCSNAKRTVRRGPSLSGHPREPSSPAGQGWRGAWGIAPPSKHLLAPHGELLFFRRAPMERSIDPLGRARTAQCSVPLASEVASVNLDPECFRDGVGRGLEARVSEILEGLESYGLRQRFGHRGRHRPEPLLVDAA